MLPTSKMLNFLSAVRCEELPGNPFIHDQMFGEGTLGSLLEPRGPVTVAAPECWQLAGLGELWPETGK